MTGLRVDGIKGAFDGTSDGCSVGVLVGFGSMSYNWYAQVPPHVSGPTRLHNLLHEHAASPPVLSGHLPYLVAETKSFPAQQSRPASRPKYL